MSAYMVEDSTINNIVATLRQNDSARYLLKRAGYDLYSDNDCKTLAIRMFVLNKRGVESRYGKGSALEFRPLDFTYRSTAPHGLTAAFKSLQCWLYQCTEGNVPDSMLYRVMDNVKGALACEIVMNTQAYQLAKWA